MSSKIDWVKNQIELNPEFTIPDLYDLYDNFVQETDAFNWKKESYKRLVRKCVQEMDIEVVDYTEDDYTKIQSQNQRKSDLNNLLRKENRETYRIYNSIQDLYEEYIKQLKSIDLSKIKVPEVKSINSSKIGILTISDAHINEIIRPSDAGGNEYDFTVFAKRLKKYIQKATKTFKSNGIKEIYIFMLGDMINSPRRLSERISMNSSLVTASLLATHIFSQMLVELSRQFKLHITFCVGNESRLTDDMDSNRIIASDNWDYMIFHNLRMMFRDKPIDFIVPKNPIQSIVNIPIGDRTYNALITHGHIFKGIPNNRSIGPMLQNYSHQGIKVDGIFLGHFHNSNISDFIQITGSIKGGDSWSWDDCGFMSRASQNIYFINEDLSLDGMKIDIQDIDENSPSYEILDELNVFDEYVNPTYNNKVVITNLI